MGKIGNGGNGGNGSDGGDHVDRDPRYVEHVDMSGWEQEVASFLREVVFACPVPDEGWVVELGTARAVNFRLLCEHFGPERCIGYDVVNYAHDPLVLERDVRTLTKADDRPVALGWNDLSEWELSPRSKLAGLEFLTRNLVPGGFYMDATLTDDALAHPAFAPLELVAQRNLIALFRRNG